MTALDMFAGFGGASTGIEAAGIDLWWAANHNPYAVEVHEANHPQAEHFIADLVDDTAGDYMHPAQLPAADLFWASPSCTSHSTANSRRAYLRNLSLFDIPDPDYDDHATESERSRATMVCVLQYARQHHPKVIIVENVVDVVRWGYKVDGASHGDGTAFRWWLSELNKLGYYHRILFLNSMFFPPTPQSRDRCYIVLWDSRLRAPDLDHRPETWCSHCERTVEARQTFKRRTKAWPLPEWGKYGAQYIYTCPSCRGRVEPPSMPAWTAIDWSDLGQRIGDRATPLAESTLDRIRRGIDKYGMHPPFVIPAKKDRGVDRSVLQPFATQTGQQESMLVNAFLAQIAGNTFEHPGSNCRTRSVGESLWSQHTTQGTGLIVPYRNQPAVPVTGGLPTQGTHEAFALAFMVKNHGGADPACRSYHVTDPFGTFMASSNAQSLVTAVHTARGHSAGRPAHLRPTTEPVSTVEAGGNHHFLLSMHAKQNGGPADTGWHATATEPFGTHTTGDTHCLINAAPAGNVRVEDCHYRMLGPDEIRAGMGFGATFKMWGSNRDKVRGLGNAVTPPVAQWLAQRVAAILDQPL